MQLSISAIKFQRETEGGNEFDGGSEERATRVGRRAKVAPVSKKSIYNLDDNLTKVITKDNKHLELSLRSEVSHLRRQHIRDVRKFDRDIRG